MRNWNDNILGPDEPKKQFLSYLWGIETWNRWRPLLQSWLSFYRTYEELKPAVNFEDADLEGVFIVPMRNWNFKRNAGQNHSG